MKSNIKILITSLFLNCAFFLNCLAADQQEFKMEDNLETKDTIGAQEYKADDLRDPFLVPFKEDEDSLSKQIEQITTPQEPLPSLTVQGIIWGGNFPQAIINNKVMKAGDTQDSVQVIDINKDGIAVLFKNRKYNLSSPASATSLKKSEEEKK